jgi:AraC-like DNA-binding protein
MTIVFEDRLSDSPYIEMVSRGYTASDGAATRPAESHWHMVFTRYRGEIYPILSGPLSSSGVVSYTEGAEILWVKLKLGAFMPHLPARSMLDSEQVLPGASSQSFWLKGSAWQFPDFENVETFIERLARAEVLVYDPLVSSVLAGQLQAVAPRTVRHRFLRATGLTQVQIRQFDRARQAEAMLMQGRAIPDTVFALGYFDQAHMTRALKRWIGHTPAQIARLNQPASQPGEQPAYPEER